MVKVSIMYPNEAGKKFDFDHYLGTHIPWTADVVSSHADFKSISVVKGLSGAARGSDPAYVAACYITFSTLEGFLEAFMPHAAELQKDIPNYTDIEPITQFSEVVISESKS